MLDASREKNEREIQIPHSERTNVEMLINEKIQYIAQSMLSDQEFFLLHASCLLIFYILLFLLHKNYEQIYK